MGKRLFGTQCFTWQCNYTVWPLRKLVSVPRALPAGLRSTWGWFSWGAHENTTWCQIAEFMTTTGQDSHYHFVSWQQTKAASFQLWRFTVSASLSSLFWLCDLQIYIVVQPLTDPVSSSSKQAVSKKYINPMYTPWSAPDGRWTNVVIGCGPTFSK